MAQLFDDEVLSVVLKFANPNRQDMVDADKVAARLSMSLDGVVRRSVSAGRAVGEIFEDLKRIEPALKRLEQKSGLIAAQASAIKVAQQILARYTPSRLEKMAEVQASKIAETSGTAGLRRQLEKHGDLIKRLVATQEGRYERNTRGQTVGRAMFLDTETTGLNALKHQVTELTATLFTFNKQTGEILNAAERTYHGFQQLAFQSKHQYLPSGLTPDTLKSQGISSTVLRRMIEKADFIIAHNAPFDKKFTERLVPQAAGAMWLDSMRGIPWRSLGYKSRAQQDLLRAHNIDPGVAHRASSDVSSAIKLLGSRSPLGGPTYLGMLMSNQGPLNNTQQVLATVKHLAEEIRGGLSQRLSESGSVAFPRDQAAYRATVKNYASRAADDVAEIFSQYIVGSIEGGITARSRKPAHSNDYGVKYGSGQSADPTPGLLGAQAISLDHRIGVINEFLRNMAVMAGPASSSQFLRMYEGQQKFQESIQQSRGRGRQLKADTRFGDDMSLGTMAGVNTQLQNQRMGIISGGLGNVFDEHERNLGYRREELVSRMLSQPWARPTRSFGNEEIEGFVKKYRGSSSMEAIQTAAQMASHVGPGGARYQALSTIMLEGQATGRRIASIRAAEAQRDAVNRLAGRMSGGSGTTPGRFRNVIGEALRGLSDAGVATSMSAVMPFTSAGGVGFGSFKDIFRFLRNRRAQAGGGTDQGMSYDERARMGIPESTDVRGSMRRDVLESKLNRLADVVEQTTRSFEHYRDTIAPQKVREAQVKYGERDMAITRSLAGSQTSIDAQIARIDAQRGLSRRGTSRRLQDIQGGFEERSSGLGMAELEAESRYESAVAMQRRRATAMQRSKAYQEGKLKDEDIQATLAGPVQRAQMRLVQAEYRRKASQLTSPEEIEALRQETAARYSVAKYGTGGGAAVDQMRAEYAQRVSGVLGGPTLAQKAETQAGRVKDDQLSKEQEFDSKTGALTQKRVIADQKAAEQRAAAEAKYGDSVNRVEGDLAKKAESANQKRTAAERKAHEARVAFLKKEDTLLGRGGSGGSGKGAGGGAGAGAAEWGSKSGMGMGIGYAMAGGALLGMREIIQESTVYAAKVQMLEIATRQMAKVNGLNTDEVLGEVEAIRNLNKTTEQANKVVQKFMFSQLDVAKASNLARVAQDLAVISGTDASEALDRITQGIVTGYTMQLHRMGLLVSQISIMKQLRVERRAEGKTGEPSEVEKRQALLNRVILEGAKIMGTYEKSMMTAGGQYVYLRKEIQETQNVIGKEFLPTFSHLMSVMTGGLQFVQAHGEAFANLAKIMTSVGAAASTIGTIAFMKWMMGSAAIPPWLKIVGVGAGLITQYALSADPEKEAKRAAGEQQDSLGRQVERLKAQRQQLLATRTTSPEWKTEFELNTAELKNAAQSQISINDELTRELAEQYTKRLKDLDDYLDAMNGKKGAFQQFWATVAGSPENSTGGKVIRAVPVIGTTGPEDIKEAEQQKKDLAQKMSTKQIRAKDLLREVEAQRVSRERMLIAPPSIINKERMEVQAIISDMGNAEGELVKLDQKLSETGQFGMKARKSMGSPREKVMIDYGEQVAKVNELGSSLEGLQKKAKGGDLASKSKLDQVYKRLGNDSISAGEEKVNDFLERRKDIVAAAGEDRDIQLSKINRQNAAQIAQIIEQTDAEKIQAQVLQGNYESEAAGIQKTFALKQQTAAKVKALTGDVDQYERQVVQNKVDRDVAMLKLQEKREQEARDRNITRIRNAAEMRAQDILESPGDAESALRGAYKERLDATNSITDDGNRLAEQLRLTNELDVAVVALGRDKKRLAAESRVSDYEDQQDLIMQLDRIVSSRRDAPRTATRRNLDEIERTRLSQRAVEEKRYSEMSAVTPARDQDALKDRHDDALNKANRVAAVAVLKEAEQHVEDTRNNLAETYQRQLSQASKLGELMSMNSLEEADAAHNTHILRLDYIEKEYEARGKTIEAEATKTKQLQEANFEELQKLLEQRRQQIEGIRNTAGTLFDIFTSKSANRTQQARDFAIGTVKGWGRTAFQNFATESFKNVAGTLGNVIPGQETVDAQGRRTPTFLGKILAGTPFGKTHTDDINKLLVKVTENSVDAEQKLTDAIKSLDDAIRNAQGLLPNKEEVTTKIKIPGTDVPKSSPLDLIPLFGGASSKDPMIFHLTSVQQANNTATQANTQALSDLTTAMRLGSLFGGKGGNPVSSLMSLFSGGSGTSDSGSGDALSTIFKAVGDSGASGSGATWPGTNIPIPTGSGGGSGSPSSGGGTAPSVGGKGGLGNWSTGSGKVANVAAIVGGGLQAFSGFKKGGASGIASGIGGILTAASTIPGPQQPFIMAGAMVADLFSSILGDSRETRGRDIQKYLDVMKYIAPVTINREMDTSGNLVSTGAHGGLSRDTGIGAFPINVQSTQYGQTPSHSWADPNMPEYYTIPGQVAYGNLPGGSQPINYNYHVTIPISAFDSRDVMSRSGDIAAALKKEIQGGSDVSIALQQSIFGSGLS